MIRSLRRTAARFSLTPAPYATAVTQAFGANLGSAKTLCEANRKLSGVTPHLAVRGEKLPKAPKDAAAQIASLKGKSFVEVLKVYEALYEPVYQILTEISVLPPEKFADGIALPYFEKIYAYSAENLTTELYNSLLSVLWYAQLNATDAIPDALQLAMRLLEDMRTSKVVQDETTDLLARAILFGDSPRENSHLLWKCVEHPELGEITFGKSELDEAGQARLFGAIEKRHNLKFPAAEEIHIDDVVYHRHVPADYARHGAPQVAE